MSTMPRSSIYFIAVCLLLAGACAAAEKPNIVLLFIDDWAWNGSPMAMDDSMPNSRMPVLQMPNVERPAREGMKFTNAYASPQALSSKAISSTTTSCRPSSTGLAAIQTN